MPTYTVEAHYRGDPDWRPILAGRTLEDARRRAIELQTSGLTVATRVVREPDGRVVELHEHKPEPIAVTVARLLDVAADALDDHDDAADQLRESASKLRHPAGSAR